MSTNAIALKGDCTMKKKRISVSQKRQITIPKDFFTAVGIESEVECFLENKTIIIRPVKDDGGELDEMILADLISQGLSGSLLLSRFKETRRQVRPAVEKLLDEAQLAAQQPDKYEGYQDVFPSDE